MAMNSIRVVEWHERTLNTGKDMEMAIMHTIGMLGPGHIACLVCGTPTSMRGIYIPLDHKEDLGDGEHFENMSRIFSFGLCEICTQGSTEDDKTKVRDALKEVVEEYRSRHPETIQ